MEDILTQLNKFKADYQAASELLDGTQAENTGLRARLEEAEKASVDVSTELSEQIVSLVTQLATAQEKSKEAQTQYEALKQHVAALEANSKTAEQRAVAIVATQGVAPIAVSTAKQTLTTDEARSEYAALKDARAKAAYYKEHKTLLLGH